MTVSVQTPYVTYIGTGNVGTFSTPFENLAEEDLTVLVNDVKLTSGYTVAGIGQEAGSVTITPNPALGDVIFIFRRVLLNRSTDYQENGDFIADDVNADFDRIWLALQDGATTVALSYPPQESALSGTLPPAAARADALLGFDANGAPITFPLPAAVGAGNMTSEGPFVAGVDFTPGVTTTLTLSQAYGSSANVASHFDAAYQGPDQYSVAGKQLIFTAPIPLGTNKVYVVGGTSISQANPAAGFIAAAPLAQELTGDESLPVQQGTSYVQTTLRATGNWIVNNLLAISDGAALVGWIQSAAGAVIRTVQDRFSDEVSIFDFMTAAQIADVRTGTASLDLSAPFAAAAAWLSTAGVFKRKLNFPAGIYNYSVGPNWAISNVSIQAMGEVHLRYTGTGNAVTLDAGAVPNRAFNINFGTEGDFIVECAGATPIGIYARNLLRSRVSGRVHGAGTASDGIAILGCVLCRFEFCVTDDDTGAWFDGSKPLVGINVTQSAAGHQTSYCTFINTNVQACGIGAFIDSTLGNVFTGGDFEFCTTNGMQVTVNAFNNKFYGMDLEQNGGADITVAGSYNEFSCDTSSNGAAGGFRFVTGSVGNRLIGGEHDQIAVDAGLGNYIGGVVYGRAISGNLQISDNGTKTAYGRNWQAQQQKWTYGPSVITAVPMTASPFTLTNTTGQPLLAFVSGGTVGALAYFRGATQLGVLATNCQVTLACGDSLSISYSSPPTVNTATL